MNDKSPDRVFIFDTTLRDGEQSPGFHLDANSKLRIARQLEKLGVDVIEAGFPISSPGDFEACRRIAREIRGATVTALARAVREDIDAVWGAIKEAETPQIHIVLSVSDLHIDRKLGMTREQVLKRGAEMVAYARSLCDRVQYSPEDAGRADPDYLTLFVGLIGTTTCKPLPPVVLMNVLSPSSSSSVLSRCTDSTSVSHETLSSGSKSKMMRSGHCSFGALEPKGCSSSAPICTSATSALTVLAII